MDRFGLTPDETIMQLIILGFSGIFNYASNEQGYYEHPRLIGLTVRVDTDLDRDRVSYIRVRPQHYSKPYGPSNLTRVQLMYEVKTLLRKYPM